MVKSWFLFPGSVQVKVWLESKNRRSPWIFDLFRHNWFYINLPSYMIVKYMLYFHQIWFSLCIYIYTSESTWSLCGFVKWPYNGASLLNKRPKHVDDIPSVHHISIFVSSYSAYPLKTSTINIHQYGYQFAMINHHVQCGNHRTR